MEDLIERLRRSAKESFFLKDLLSEAADALEGVSPMEWIPVTERLPDFEGCLLCMRKTVFGLSVQEVLYYEDGEFSYNGIDNLTDGAVTHWMPLPKPPEECET